MFSNIPFADNENTFIFTNGGSLNSWFKPKGIKFVNIMCMGGGGGGGQGVTNSGAGGGGGAAAISSALYTASSIPDTLTVIAGVGGAGATTSGGSGSAGGTSYVLVRSDTQTQSSAALCSALGGNGAAGQSAATASIARTLANMPYAAMALQYLFIAGGAGSLTTALALSSRFNCAGAAGGGILNDGYNVTGSGILPTINGGTSTNIDGADGIWIWKPMCGTGGAGGRGVSGISPGGTGGKGGNGAYGCGGGGGGAGNVSSGNGGRGGDGLVIITCW